MATYGVNQLIPNANPQLGPMMGNGGLTPQQLIGNANLAQNLYGEIGQQIGEEGQANALAIQAQGAEAEANQYNISAGIAGNNAQLALVGGDIEKYQAMRQVQKTIGTQQATGAASGFANAGSALDVATSSLRQGLLQTQLIGTNADLKAGGYLEQASSARAEASAATAAGGYANAMAASAQAQAAAMGNLIAQNKQLIAGIPGGANILPGANGKPGQQLDPYGNVIEPNVAPVYNPNLGR